MWVVGGRGPANLTRGSSTGANANARHIIPPALVGHRPPNSPLPEHSDVDMHLLEKKVILRRIRSACCFSSLKRRSSGGHRRASLHYGLPNNPPSAYFESQPRIGFFLLIVFSGSRGVFPQGGYEIRRAPEGRTPNREARETGFHPVSNRVAFELGVRPAEGAYKVAPQPFPGAGRWLQRE